MRCPRVGLLLTLCAAACSPAGQEKPSVHDDPTADADAGDNATTGGDSGADEDAEEAPTPALLTAEADEVHLRLSQYGQAAPAVSKAHLRSGLYYFRHSSEAYQLYTAREHQTTRGIAVNWALEISQCVNAADCATRGQPASAGFAAQLRDSQDPLWNEIAQRSDAIVVHYGNMPRWLSSCSQKYSGGIAGCDEVWQCQNRRYSTYPPADATAWRGIVRETVDALLDLTVRGAAPRDVYLEATNEPDATCYWTDTHEIYLAHWKATAIAFHDAKTELCASKGLSAARCARLKLGGSGASTWDGAIGEGGPRLNEALITYALAEAQSDPRVQLDFVSFHEFFPSTGGGPRARLAGAKAAYDAAYDGHAGVSPPFPRPEVLFTEWNASGAERAGPRHPALLAEGFFGLVENDLRLATIASLDQQAGTATLDSNDFGLLATTPSNANYARPAFYVYSGMAAFADANPGYATATSDALRLIVSSPRVQGALTCHDLVAWELVPHPLAQAIVELADPSRLGAAGLVASYTGATPSLPLPSDCTAYGAALTNDPARALCEDIAAGTCAHIPTPTPVGGRACDPELETYFAEASVHFHELRRRETTPLEFVVHGFDGDASSALLAALVVREDHASPAPDELAPAIDPTASTATFALRRNDVAFFHDLCVR